MKKNRYPRGGGVAVKSHPSHRGAAVRVGSYQIFVGGLRYLQPTDLVGFDYLIPLEDRVPVALGQIARVLGCSWQDYSPPPEGFDRFLKELVIPLLDKGKKILVYCVGGHGRTGTFVASLIALLEDEKETLDPIAAVRERHCYEAVETRGQAAAIFSLRGKPLPEFYEDEFFRPPVIYSKCPYKTASVPPETVEIDLSPVVHCDFGFRPAETTAEEVRNGKEEEGKGG